jgi:molybdate transport system substrate-binding protein
MRIRRQHLLGATTVAIAAALTLGACSSSSKPASSTTSSTTGSAQLSGSINVLAASSLTAGFTALASQFQAAHPGTKINLDFASSSTLVEQIQNGAPADVFASADTSNMTKLQTSGDVTVTPVVFAKNEMEIAVAKGNPRHIATVSDLAEPGLILVLCASDAPCGKYADQLATQDHVTFSPKSREVDAKSTLTKVETGDADAALVYVTDVKSAGTKVSGVVIPTGQNVVATLPIAALKGSKNAALANAWVAFVTSSASEQTLQTQYGFLAP